MTWEWLNRRLKKGRSDVSAAEIRQPEVRWVAAADNPWGVPVLDVRPVTLQMLAFSADPKCAQNALSFGQDDGTSFIGIEPAGPGSIPVRLRFPIDRILADGTLFVPSQMEHKWAIYFHRGHMIFIRSWLRKESDLHHPARRARHVWSKQVLSNRRVVAPKDPSSGRSARRPARASK